jgi:hypothetical protein
MSRSRAELDAVIDGALRDLELEYERHDEGAFLVKLAGQHKLATMTWLVIGERSMLVEAFFMRCPEENHGGTYQFLLQRNARTYGVHFSADSNGDLWLTGQVPLAAVTADEIDRLMGCVLTYADENFDAAIQLGFATAIEKEREWRAKLIARGEAPWTPDNPLTAPPRPAAPS